jgi:RND family efflux transporter MFP subunit
VLQPLLVLGVLVAGFLGAMGLASQREAPPRVETVQYAPLVRTIAVRPEARTITVRGHGALRARTRVDLVPQVGGEVIAIHPGLRAGGRFAAGEVLLEVDPIDYELAVARARADVEGTETALVALDAEARAAREEWLELQPEAPVPPLVAREPQLREAAARREAAIAAVRSAELDLARTKLRLPWAGRVVEALVDLGEVVRVGQSVGSVYATDVFEVALPLRQDQLRWVSLADDGDDAAGTSATVSADVGGRTVELTGRAVRLEAELDPASRLARVVVELRPDGLPREIATRLLPGLFVRVALDGGRLPDVVTLPRVALREDGIVWLVEDGRLRFAHADVRHSENGDVIVSGLGEAIVVTSELEVVTDGMAVRIDGGSGQ